MVDPDNDSVTCPWGCGKVPRKEYHDHLMTEHYTKNRSNADKGRMNRWVNDNAFYLVILVGLILMILGACVFIFMGSKVENGATVITSWVDWAGIVIAVIGFFIIGVFFANAA